LSTENIFNILILFLIFAFLLYYIKPSLLLTPTTTSGGDTSSHNYLAKYMHEYLLPRFKISGWSPDWYAGFPIFQFYFPLPFVMISLLSYTIPFEISFKIITMLGVFLLPLASFLFMKLLKFNFPIPILAALFSLIFLFNTGNSMWGGNIPSTLAGEFSYSLSLAFTILFLAVLYRAMESGKKRFFIIGILLFFAIALTHIYTLIFAVFSSLFFLFSKDFFKNFKDLFKFYLIGVLLISFWLVPIVFKIEYNAAFHYIWDLKSLKEIFPDIMIPLFVLGFFGIILGFMKRDDRVFYITFSLILALLLYKFGPLFSITDIRFIPFFQILSVYLAAYIVGYIVIKMKYNLFLLLVVFVVFLWVSHNVSYIPAWLDWNYKGFEGKVYWSQFSNITTYLKSLPYGRVVHEYSNSHDKFGSPRAFEDIPYFSGKPVLEGLSIESAINAPYVFNIQSEISLTPTCPIPGLSCNPFDIDKAYKHLDLFNVKYLVATTDKLKSKLRDDDRFEYLKSFDEIEIYKIQNNADFVELAKYEPVLIKTDNWRDTSLEWFKNHDTDIPIVFTEDNRFRLRADDLSDIEKIPIEKNCFVNSDIDNEIIKIETDCIDKPLLIKMSYYPNWQIDGADRIYLVSPAFMLIYPKQKNVTIYYGNTFSDNLGIMLSIIGLAIFILYIRSSSKTKP